MQEKVLITGISGALGRLIAKQIHLSYQVIGIDKRPFDEPGCLVDHHMLDLRHKSAYQVLRKQKPDCIIHVGVIRNPQKHRMGTDAYEFNLEVTSQMLNLAEELGVRKFIFLSTANLYGPSARTSGFLTEESALHGANRSPEVRDLVALDMMIQSFFWKQPHIETVVLRPVHIVGPHLNNAPSRYLRLEMPPTLLGFDPMVQLVDERDVAHAIELSLAKGIRGIFNIVGDMGAPLSRILKAVKASPLPLPEFAIRTGLEMAFRYRFSTYPPGELDHLKYACLIDGARANQALGYKPQYSLKQTLKQVALKKQANPRLLANT